MKNRPLSWVALIALLMSIITIAVVVLSTMGFRMEWWGYASSLKILRGAVYGGVIAIVFSLLGIFITWPGRKRGGLVFSIIGVSILLPSLAMPLYWHYSKSKLPPIQDISTDLENPPEFWEAPTSRITHPGAAVAEQQLMAFPDIQPAMFSEAKDHLFDKAVALVRDFGWKLVSADSSEGRIEATVTTFWYGFKDDVVIRLTETDAGTKVDMRSTSRFGGGGDGGSNANRIRAFLAALKE